MAKPKRKPTASKTTKKPAVKAGKTKAPVAKSGKTKAKPAEVAISWHEVSELVGATADDPKLNGLLARCGRANARKTDMIDLKPHGVTIRFETAGALGRSELPEPTSVVSDVEIHPSKSPEAGLWKGALPLDLARDVTPDAALTMGATLVVDDVPEPGWIVIEHDGAVVVLQFESDELLTIHFHRSALGSPRWVENAIRLDRYGRDQETGASPRYRWGPGGMMELVPRG